MTRFTLCLPENILFGRGQSERLGQELSKIGPSGILVHGANLQRISPIIKDLTDKGLQLELIEQSHEPSLSDLQNHLQRGLRADWVAAIGGGSVLDMGKALAALLPAKGDILRHFEIVGQAAPLDHAPLPFFALPTTSGTGAEATRNAVITLSDHGRKVSLRDPKMLAFMAIIDPSLTDNTPKSVTLASGMDAITQVIEPYICNKSNPFTQAIAWPAIEQGLRALSTLTKHEDAKARDDMAWVSLAGGIALANSGLGAVHGLAGVIGGLYPAPHGAVCGALLGPILAQNQAHSSGEPAKPIAKLCQLLGEIFGTTAQQSPYALHQWALREGLPKLSTWGIQPEDFDKIAAMAMDSSSMKANPVTLPLSALVTALRLAF